MSSIFQSAEAVLEGYCKRLPDELRGVSELLNEAIRVDRKCAETLGRLQSELHRMGGSALCMGYPFLGRSIIDLQDQIQQGDEQSSHSHKRIDPACMDRMRSISRIAAYVSPENSHLLQEIQRSEPGVRGPRAEPVSRNCPRELRFQRILFADDDFAIRMFMRDALTSLDVKTFEIHADGKSLLESARSFDPDIIITDWAMKPVNGLDIVRDVRSGRAGIPEATRIMFLTSVNALERVQYALKQGPDYFLLKPFTRNGLSRAIRRIMP